LRGSLLFVGSRRQFSQLAVDLPRLACAFPRLTLGSFQRVQGLQHFA
jgi:hypothetical protein